MKKINIIASLILLFFGWGCVKQPGTPLCTADGQYNLALDISRAVEKDDNSVGKEQDIVSARMIVIAKGSGNPQAGRVTYNHKFDASELVGAGKDVIKAFVRSGQSDVYLIINEPTDNSAALNKIEHLDQLQAAIINFPTAAHSVGSLVIPMVQVYQTDIKPYPDVTTVNTDNGVERLWAKVRVRFKATDDKALIDAGYPNMTGTVVNKVQLHNVPEFSYVIAQDYPSTSALRADGQAITKDYTLTTTATESAGAYYEFYVPEFLGASANRHSFLKVYTTQKDGSSRYYILDLKTTIAEQSFNLLRNTFYDITATIRGYGQGDIDVVTNVLPWNNVTSSPEVGEFLEIDKQDKTITLGKETAIKVTTSVDLSALSIASEKGNVTWRVVKDIDGGNQQDRKGTIFVSINLDATSSEFFSDVDKLTVKVGKFSQSVTLNHEPCMAQRFARGMLVSDGAGGVTIGAPNSDPKQNLLFKFGRPMGMLSHAANALLTLVYNHSVWPTSNGTNFNPVALPFSPEYSGGDKDYMEKQIDANGWAASRDAGDVCRIMGQTDGHFWRIPTQNEWKALVAEGKKAISMNGQPLQGSNVPTADFGWFCGPTAQQGTEATAGTPP
ncbi:MAG: hypothetical protein RSD75_05975, partial [Mucinivorans sp.]